MDNFCIITYGCCIIRNIFGHYTPCTDGGIIANFNMIDNTDIWANIYIIANYSGLPTAIGTNRCKLRKVDIVSNHSSWVDNQRSPMTDEQAIANFCGAVDIDSVFLLLIIKNKVGQFADPRF